MRQNISSVRTKQLMAEALETLLKTTPIDKITIHDITGICGVNRQTFYYHFHDIYELAEWSFKSHTNQLIGEEISLENWDAALLKVAHFFSEKRAIFIGLVNSIGLNYIINFIYNYIKPYITNLIEKAASDKDVSEYYKEFLANFYTSTLSGLLIEWLLTDKDKEHSPEELVHLIKLTMQGNIESAFNRYIAEERKKG